MALPVHPLAAHRDRSAVEDLATKEATQGAMRFVSWGQICVTSGTKDLATMC
jgi:hypothetical protein